MHMKIEIFDDERGGKIEIEKKVTSSDHIEKIEVKLNGVDLECPNDPTHPKKYRKLTDPEGDEHDLLFAISAGSRWVYINGRWYKIG